MKQLLGTLLIFAWAAPAVAAPVLVRSGEHGSFTRIVVDIDPAEGWDVTQEGREVTLDLPRHRDGFRTSGVFRRITRERLQSLSSDRGRLTLTLGCDCVVNTAALAPRFIILDIAPREGQADTEAAAMDGGALDWSDSIAATERFFGLEDLVATPDTAAETNAETPAVPQEPIVLPLIPEQRRSFDLAGPVSGGMQLDPRTDDSASDVAKTGNALTVLEDRLARQIGRAATQGLLKPAPDQRMEEALRREIEPQASAPEPPEATLDALLDRGGMPGNLRISSTVDTRNKPANSVTTTMEGLTCADPELFAVQDWGKEGEFAAEIARHRNALYGEFDKLDRGTQIDLARAYIYYGFGAEALQIASLDLREEKVDAAIMVIARLLEYGPGPRTDALVRFAECDSDAALWAILADNGSGRPERMNTAAALRALNKLPYHLRSFIAPELSKRLRQHGDGDAAAHAMRSISRTQHKKEGAAKLEQAEIDLSEGHDKKASEALEEVIADNSLEAPRALIRFIDLQIASGQAISKDTALLAEAYAAEYRNSELAPEISRAHVMALAKSGQYPAAFEVLETARSHGMVTQQLMSSLYQTLQKEADDVTFLRRTMAMSAPDLAQISPKVRLGLGARLLELGFASQAEAKIADVDRDVSPREQQLLRGRIHLAQGQHDEALAAAAAFSGDEFSALRADTLYAAGRFEEAAAIYAQIGASDRAEAAAWKAPTGTLPALAGDSTLTRATGIADRAAPAPEGGLLARAGALLSDSTSLTSEIEDLLANPELSVGAGG